jgi:hypothetical protein
MTSDDSFEICIEYDWDNLLSQPQKGVELFVDTMINAFKVSRYLNDLIITYSYAMDKSVVLTKCWKDCVANLEYLKECWPLIDVVMNTKSIPAVHLVIGWIQTMKLDEVNVQLVQVMFSKLAFLEKDIFLNDMLFLLNKLRENYKVEFSDQILMRLTELREFKDENPKQRWKQNWEKNMRYQLKLSLKLDKYNYSRENLKKYKEEMFDFINKLQIQGQRMKVIKNKKIMKQEDIDKKTLIYSLKYIDIFKLDRLASLSDKDKGYQSAFDVTRKLINFRWRQEWNHQKDDYKNWLKDTYERAAGEKNFRYTRLDDLKYEKIQIDLKRIQNKKEREKILPNEQRFIPKVENDHWCRLKDLFEDVNLKKPEKLAEELED